MRNFLVTVFTLLVGTSVYAEQEPKTYIQRTTCERTVQLHGFLSRAQLDCNYHYTSQELIHESEKCTKHELGDKYGKEVMRLGMDQFEARKRGDMKGQLCSTVLKEFPNYIKK
ncbi:hypothetical protein [Acinetobacter sp. yr461]|uniref:hypothetical protein n=1 Tax=Acinetobacter sp. yr461 TaxID=1761742 RepID=UPI0008D5DE32|nr:hypothetical protein [Acinetobacter sp. yr461]SEO54884.1 hypothetical protein SAMN04487817_106115 [Acinetobacter sp. yr461]